MGISLRHSGHFLLVGSAGAALRAARAFHAFIGATMKKYTAAAINRKLITSFTNIPYVMSVPLTFALNAEKSGLETTAAMVLLMMLLTNDVTTAPKAAPITTATARSMTLPRMMNCLNPLNMLASFEGRIIQEAE